MEGGGDSVVETYAYDLGNRLARHVRTQTADGGTTVATTLYRHDADGVRVGKRTTVAVNGVERPELGETLHFLVDPYNPTGYSQVLEEFDGDGTLLKSYAIGDDVLSQSSPSSSGTGPLSFSLEPSYFLHDGHGSTRQLSDSLGGITAQYGYDAYGVMLGQPAGAQQAQATSLLHGGERFDTSLQQCHLRARDYNPAWGNTAINVVKTQVPSGIRIFEGVAAPQGGLVGGGNQVFIQNVNPSWIVP